MAQQAIIASMTGVGDKYAVRVTADKAGGYRFAITSADGAKTHASALLVVDDAQALLTTVLDSLNHDNGLQLDDDDA